MKNIFQEICNKCDFIIKKIGFDENHVHIMIQTLPDKSPSRYVFKNIKIISDFLL